MSDYEKWKRNFQEGRLSHECQFPPPLVNAKNQYLLSYEISTCPLLINLLSCSHLWGHPKMTTIQCWVTSLEVWNIWIELISIYLLNFQFLIHSSILGLHKLTTEYTITWLNTAKMKDWLPKFYGRKRCTRIPYL